MKSKPIGIAGAGFAGVVLARQLAELGHFKVEVYDERSHIGGNSHTERDAETQVMAHVYGPHIFHTSNEEVWRFMNRFGQFGNYTNRVKAVTARGVFSLPINLLTINQFFGKKFSPKEAEDFLKTLGEKSKHAPQTFEEQGLAFLGKELYQAFFHGYTSKQWGVDPKELPASILQRLPVRFNYDDNYFSDKYQGIPVDGYTKMMERMLAHENIKYHVGQKLTRADKDRFSHLFFTGMLDDYFDCSVGSFRYRTLKFEKFKEKGDYQGNAVMNYCEQQVPYTRISEHKHFAPWEKHDDSVCFREFAHAWKKGDIPYYPLRLATDKTLLHQYVQMGLQEEKVTFAGRLGTYRYLDMHNVVEESLQLSQAFLKFDHKKEKFPAFMRHPVDGNLLLK